MRISACGQRAAAAKNRNEITKEYLRTIARIFSTDNRSFFPQYCAARIVVPMVRAAQNRLRTNCTCAASDTADKESWFTIPSIMASEALTSADIRF